MAKKSCTTNLLEFLEKVSCTLDSGDLLRSSLARCTTKGYLLNSKLIGWKVFAITVEGGPRK
jgi:hypothetical protein